jgi:hypothetical protein
VVLGGSDVLAGQIESPGMNQTAFAAGGTGDDLATAVAPATNGLYVAGNFSGNANFGTRNLTGGGLFFARLEVTNAVTVVVTNSPAVIVLQPTNRTVTAGQTATFTGAAGGTPTPTLLWRRSVNGGTTWTNLANGVGFAGVATGTLQVSGTTTAQSGNQFRLTATNSMGGVVSAAAILTVNPATTAPVIIADPAGRIVAAGGNVTFTVSATGTSPIYFWRKDGTFLPAATNLSLTVSNVKRAASGLYSVILTNSSGSVTSAPALLRVLVPQRVEGGTNLHRLSDGRFQLHFRDPDGTLASDLTRLEIHSTTNFVGTGTIWITNTTGFSIINGLIRFEDASSTNLHRRFYRIIEK